MMGIYGSSFGNGSEQVEGIIKKTNSLNAEMGIEASSLYSAFH